jgi:LacI family transcriptional regulator
MANQKEVAKALGVTQATVSLALRGSQRISSEMRQKVRDTAERMGYHLNSYLTVLMSNIRAGKTLSEKGVIGLLVEARSQKSWHTNDTHRMFHQALVQRAEELGFHIEPFFLLEPEMHVSRIDQILHARGITGIILAPPCCGALTLKLNWSRYAAIGIGFGWGPLGLNLVGYDNLQNYITAFNELRKLGYKRIGTALGHASVSGNRRGTKWYTGYLECQNSIPKSERIPVFASVYAPPGAASEGSVAAEFQQWVRDWRPDAVLSLVGREKAWLLSMGLNIPQDIGLACLARSPNSCCAGIDEKGELIGATALELVAAQIARNEFGAPAFPRVTTIAGQWVPGASLQTKDGRKIKI